MKKIAIFLISISILFLAQTGTTKAQEQDEIIQLKDLAREDLVRSSELVQDIGLSDEFFIASSTKNYQEFRTIGNVETETENWGFKYYTNDPGYEYYYIVNNQEYGPYYSDTPSPTKSTQAYFSDEHFAFDFYLGEKKYINIDNKEHGPCRDIYPIYIRNTNYGFFCNKDEESYAFINGEKYYEKISTQEFILLDSDWGYIYEKDGQSFVRINGDLFGPYDDIRDFRMYDNFWAFGYENNNEFFILSSSNPAYKLPLTKEQAGDYEDGIFYSTAKYYNPIQCHMDCKYFGGDRLKFSDKTWTLRYLINDEYITFSNNDENISFTNQAMHQRLKGKILLKVEDNGRAYYVNPKTENMRYLGRPADAFNVMREEGVGISEKDFNSFGEQAPSKLAGTILLRVEKNGEAYYVNPDDNKMHYLGRPADAFNVMRNLGLGISNDNFTNL